MEEAPSFRISKRPTTELGTAVRSTELVVPRTPEGPHRLPLTSTSVRWAPRPRSEMERAPGPPSVTNPENELSICWPAATVEVCRMSAVFSKPARADVSLVMTVIGEALENSSRRMREPVTTISSTGPASSVEPAGVASSSAAVSCVASSANPGWAEGSAESSQERWKQCRSVLHGRLLYGCL